MVKGNKYRSLQEFLAGSAENEIVFSFAELERVLGFSLPNSARIHRPWWANQTPPSSQCRSWMSAGWYAFPDLRNQTVTFRKWATLEPLAIRGQAEGRTSESSRENELQEDQVKEYVRVFLENKGWRTKINWGRAHGVDIEATSDGGRWLIEVKGCGSRNAMRVNYFLSALSELLQRMSDRSAKYSIALPDLPQFRGLWERLHSLAKERTGISCLFVRADGDVVEAL